MFYPITIAARSQRGNRPSVSGTPRRQASGRFSALMMLAALAIRLASLMPGVPVLHWHGAIAVIHPGGGIPHDFGGGVCTGDPNPGGHTEDTPESAYYSFAAIPGLPDAPPYWTLPDTCPAVKRPPQESVWTPNSAAPPGPTRGPPASRPR